MSDNGVQNDLIAERYKPLFPRARGGFSDVIIAWDTRLARRVAIKRINTGKSLSVLSLEEARTAALLSSPNIVSVYDFESNDPETLIIMENVDGPTLAELMKESTELLDIDVITTILDGVVTALEYAHENKVLHLDIKPANILIDQSGHVKVSDFGLAELAGASGFGEVQGGTIGYMPPEQLSGDEVDVRTDLWALAILSYQLLTGTNPFFALSFRESLSAIVLGNYALPSELRPALGGAVDEVIVKALSPEKVDRQEDVAEFWQDLRPYLGKIGPGRRTLKALTRAWAGREAAYLENTQSSLTEEADEYLDGGFVTPPVPAVTPDTGEDEDAGASEGAAPENPYIAIWNGNYEDQDGREDLEYLEDEDASQQQQQQREQRRQKQKDQSGRKAKREPKPPLWQRLSPRGQGFFSRCICALATASMVWLAMSALPYLSAPLAQAATAAAVNTGNPTPALLDAAFVVKLVLILITLTATFIMPRIGSALAIIGLALGFFFTGNWIIGILVFVGCLAWWLCIGRHEHADSAVLVLSPLLAAVGLPLLVPLLAGYFQNWRRALGTAALSCFICSLLSLLTSGYINTFFSGVLGIGGLPSYGQFSTLPLHDLLSISPTLLQMPNSNQLFMPLVNLLTQPEFWFVLAGWLGASVVMSLLSGGKSRVKYTVATLLGTVIVAAGYLVPLFIFVGAGNGALLTTLIIRLVIALVVCLLLILIGVQMKPYVKVSRGRTT